MTKQLKPQQLLEIARVVIPKEKWMICPDGRIVADETCMVFEPHKPTERGQAQLMKVVFALLDAGDDLSYWYLDGVDEWVAYISCSNEFNSDVENYGKGKTKEEAILFLAYRVLCNAN